MQRGLVRTDTAVAADQVQLADRHIQGGFVSVFQMQKLLQQGLTQIIYALAHVHVHQASVATNAVGAVYHRVAHLQFRQVFDQRLNITHRFLLAFASGAGAGGKKFGFRHQIDGQLSPSKACVQAAGGNAKRLGALHEFCERVKAGWTHATGSEEVQQAFAPAITFGQYQNPL